MGRSGNGDSMQQPHFWTCAPRSLGDGHQSCSPPFPLLSGTFSPSAMNADVITLHNRSSLQAPFHSCWSMDSAIALPHAPCRDSWRKTSWFPVQGGFVRQSEYIWDCLTWNQCLLLQVHKGIHWQHSTNCWQLYRTCFYRRDIPLLDPQSSLSRDFTAFCFSWRKSKTKYYTSCRYGGMLIHLHAACKTSCCAYMHTRSSPCPSHYQRVFSKEFAYLLVRSPFCLWEKLLFFYK